MSSNIIDIPDLIMPRPWHFLPASGDRDLETHTYQFGTKTHPCWIMAVGTAHSRDASDFQEWAEFHLN